MININQQSFFWRYISASQKALLIEGLYLYQNAIKKKDKKISDYSYLVFPFAKAYEGFLKKIFLDMGFISQKEYQSDYFRIGKALNPNLEKRLRKFSVYEKIVSFTHNENIAQELWLVWKKGRNQVFHYFPHNIKALSFSEAEKIINDILIVMEKMTRICQKELFKENN